MTNHDKAEALNTAIILCNEREEIYKESIRSTEEDITMNNMQRFKLQEELSELLKQIENLTP